MVVTFEIKDCHLHRQTPDNSDYEITTQNIFKILHVPEGKQHRISTQNIAKILHIKMEDTPNYHSE